ncbi:MAG: hypothetical protein V1725_01960 [archaeon]
MRRCMLLIVLFLCSASVFGYGIAPAQDVLPFSPGEHTLQVSIINEDGQDLVFSIEARGALAKYVIISTPTIVMGKQDAEKTFDYSIDLPENMMPGKQTLEIAVRELPLENRGKTSVALTTTLVHQLIIDVPYPGTYAEANFFISSGDANEPVTFTLGVFNRGKEDITAHAAVRVFNENTEIGELQSTAQHIASADQTSIALVWTNATRKGVYRAEATLFYADKRITFTKEFTIGKNQVSIQDISVDNLNVGEIARMDITVENEWNTKAENVFANVKILDGEGLLQANFTTSAISMNPQTKNVLHGYWETKGVQVGTYTIAVILNYGGKSIERFFETVIGINSFNVKEFGAIHAEAVAKTKPAGVLPLIIVIVILIAVIAFLARKLKKKESTPPSQGQSLN